MNEKIQASHGNRLGPGPHINAIERDVSPTESAALDLAVFTHPDLPEVIGWPDIYEERIALAETKVKLGGCQHLEWFIENQRRLPPELMDIPQGTRIHFPGLIAVFADGERRIPYAYKNEKIWEPCWQWLRPDDSDEGIYAHGDYIAVFPK